MNTSARIVSLLAFGLVAGASARAGVIVYEQDFENPGSIGNEWSNSATDQNDHFTRFSKRRTNETLTLTLDTMGGQAYSLVFDLYLIDSWDGGNPTWGQDRFSVKVDTALVFSELLDNAMGSAHSTYRDPDEVGMFGFGKRDVDRDAIYRAIALDFVANGEVTQISFFGSGLQGKNDESWGIDNVSVAAVPSPGVAAALALGALGAASRRRRR
jgi:MYXO-CTERM domain-containing protein